MAGEDGSTLNWPRGRQEKQPLFGLREDRCTRVARRANEFCLADARRISHLSGEPLEARLNPVQAFVVTVRALVLILKAFIAFHAATLGRQRRVRHGVFTLMQASVRWSGARGKPPS